MNNTIASIRPLAIWKIRLITLALFVFALIMFKLGQEAYLTLELKSLAIRASAASATALTGALALLGMHWYLRRFVFSMRMQGEEIVITVAGWFMPRHMTFHIAELTDVTYHDFATHRGHAPWYRLMAGGRGFLVDANPKHLQLNTSAFGSLRQKAANARKQVKGRRKLSHAA